MKVVAMLMVLIFHMLHGGGIVTSAARGVDYYSYQTLSALVYVGVNCFVLVTGYFYSQKFKVKKLLYIYLDVLFYSFVIGFVFYLQGDPFDWVRNIFVISVNRYWFVSAFVGLTLLAPLLAAGVNTLSVKDFRTILLILGFFMCVSTIIFQSNMFDIKNGYTAFWLLYVYLVGAYIRKTDIQLNKWLALALYFSASFLTLCSIYLLKRTIFMKYNSITVLFASIGLFLFFKNVNIKNDKLTKIIMFFSQSAFATYIIQSNPYIFGLRNQGFVFVTSKPIVEGLAFVISFALAAMTVCVCFNYLKIVISRSIARYWSKVMPARFRLKKTGTEEERSLQV